MIIPNQFRLTLGALPPLGRIIGGYPVNITSVPWQAVLLSDNRPVCGASIISSRWILTSAGCLGIGNPKEYIVRVGSEDIENADNAFKVAAAKIHHRFNHIDHDFGLLRLAEELTLSERIRPVKLPKVGDIDPDAGTMALVSGWGTTRNASESAQYLRAVEVPTVGQKVCERIYRRLITVRMFCAGFVDEGGKDGE